MPSPKSNFVIAGMTLLVLHVHASIFVTDVKMNKMIELNARKPHCRLHTDRGNIQSTVLNTDPLKIRQVPVETVRTLENVCFEGNQLTGEIQGERRIILKDNKINFVLWPTCEGGLSFVSNFATVVAPIFTTFFLTSSKRRHWPFRRSTQASQRWHLNQQILR